MKKTFLTLGFVFVIGMVPVAHATPCASDAGCGGSTPTCDIADGSFQCIAGPSQTITNSGATQTSGTSGTNTGQSSGFVPLTNIPGLTTGATATSAGLATFLNNLYKYLIGLAAILAVIEIIWGGLEISTKDSVSSKSDGRERITQAILGLVLVLSPVLVFSIINPSILNLSLNLPPIKQAPAQQTQASTPATPCTGNCNTGAPVPNPTSNTSTQNAGLYPCSGTNCTSALASCNGLNTNAQLSLGLEYTGSVICAKGSSVDPNSPTNPTSCPAGESFAVNCTAVQTANQGG